MDRVPKKLLKIPPGGTGQASDGDWEAPRLGKALLEAKAGQGAYQTKLEAAISTNARQKIGLRDSDRSKFESELKALFGHIGERLAGSLDEVWMSSAGYNSPELADLVSKARKQQKAPSEVIEKSDADMAELAIFYDSPEERWARAFCEMVVFSMYHTPGQVYGFPGDDTTLFLQFPQVHGIAYACQTLSTYGIMSRGVGIEVDFKSSLGSGCGCTCGTVNYKAFDKRLTKPMKKPSTKTEKDVPSGTPPDKVKQELAKLQQQELKQFGDKGENLGAPTWATTEELAKAKITPGSVIVFNAGGIDYNGQDIRVGEAGIAAAHIASVVRTLGSKIQFIDTGVIVGNAEGYAGEGGTADHAWRTGAISSARSAVGVGVLRDCSGTLSEYAKKTAAAKPLGLTRLVIATSDKKRVLFISKLLHMRWPISKLIWSLRGLPTDGLTVAWLVYVTRAKEWTKAVIKALTGAPAAPATLLTGAGELKLANVIIATDNNPVDVYRSHLLTPGDWRHNLNQGSRSTPGDVAKWSIDAATPQDVLEWCVKPGNFGQRLIRQVTDGDKGTIDDTATGDALVDP